MADGRQLEKRYNAVSLSAMLEFSWNCMVRRCSRPMTCW